MPRAPHDVLGLGWLVQPRWGAAAAFLVALALSHLGFVQAMDALPVLLGAGVTITTNLLATRLGRLLGTQPLAVGLLLFDTAVLTSVLYASGGASNPLTALYMIPIAMGALMLPRSYAWVLSGTAVLAFGVLFFGPGQAHDVHAGGHGGGHSHGMHVPAARGSLGEVFDLHLRGMWMAFTLTAVLVTYFVTRVASALRARDAQLARTRARAKRAERVASLASLAASTAHELGTPLASISLAASEMKHALGRGTDAEHIAPDVDIVRTQVKRCRDILDAMLREAGETLGEAPTNVTVAELVDDATGMLPEAERSRVVRSIAGALPVLGVPRRIVAQSLHNLLRNALDASPLESSVAVEAEQAGERIRFTVRDEGVGMDTAALEEAMEPFVTSKPDRGQGLGLFLARAVAERLGGELRLDSQPGRGTEAVFEFLIQTLKGS